MFSSVHSFPTTIPHSCDCAAELRLVTVHPGLAKQPIIQS
jgi:hypothetical protein